MNFLPRCKHIHKKKKKPLKFKNAVNYSCLKCSEPVCRRNEAAPALYGARAGKLTATQGTWCPQQDFPHIPPASTTGLCVEGLLFRLHQY